MRSAGLGSQRSWHDSGWRVTAAGERRRSPAASVAKDDVDGHFVLHQVLQSLRSDSWIPYLPFLLDRIAGEDDRVAWGVQSISVRAGIDRQLGSVGRVLLLAVLLIVVLHVSALNAWPVAAAMRRRRTGVSRCRAPVDGCRSGHRSRHRFLLVDGGGAAPLQHRRDHAPVVSNPSRLPWFHPMSRRPPCRDMIARSRTG